MANGRFTNKYYSIFYFIDKELGENSSWFKKTIYLIKYAPLSFLGITAFGYYSINGISIIKKHGKMSVKRSVFQTTGLLAIFSSFLLYLLLNNIILLILYKEIIINIYRYNSYYDKKYEKEQKEPFSEFLKRMNK